MEVPVERHDDLLGLVLAQEPVIDEDARELVADRLVHEQRWTAESTPPLSAHSTRCRFRRAGRIRSTCSSITAAGVHAGGAAATL